MFIGRERELNTLEKLYNSNKFEFAVIYGRRRVGKTALINEFLKNKRSIYFMGVESNSKQNLENFSKSVIEFGTSVAANTSFASFQDALEYVFELSKNERIILAIDEYPYIAGAAKSLASTLQMLIDKHKDSSKLMLILCGSSMSFMENQVLSYKAPLYGRKTAQIKVLPFSFEETFRYLKNANGEDRALIYGIVGGTPQYLLQINDKSSIEDIIKSTYLNANSPFFDEPINLLKQEVREPAIYNAIITAIATGASRLSEISGKVGEETSTCSFYIKNLISLGIIKKESPYGEENSKRSLYSVADNMFRFWYRFVPDNSSLIARGADEAAWGRIKPFVSEYMGTIFEEICKEYLWKQLIAGRSPIDFRSLGRWWGNDAKEKKQVEIDIIGEQDKSAAVFAECKWTNEKVDLSVLDKLIYRSKLFSYENTHLYLFSKCGFTTACINKAEEMKNVTLITYDDIINGF